MRIKNFFESGMSGTVRGWTIFLLILFSLFFRGFLGAQTAPPEPPVRPAESAAQKLAPEDLNRLLAPIALYPDALIALILPASTVPSEIVIAVRFIASNGDATQIGNQPWDDSVKSLARYPDVLKWMDQNIEWTTALGDAFLDQPADVMNSIQRLRVKALAAGNLFDTPQQTIVKEETSIRIVPAEPDVIYVPEYDPEVVYVQPYSQDLGPVLTFGAGFAVGSWLTYDLDWNRRGIYVGHWRPGWKRDGDWDRGHQDWGDKWDRGDRGRGNTFIDVVNINSDTARHWQPSASSQRRQAREQRVRHANAHFSNAETADANRAPAGASAASLPEDSRINQVPRPSRFDNARQDRERDRRNVGENRNGRSSDLPAAQTAPGDAPQGNNQKPPESAASPDIAVEQGAPTPGGGREKDSRDLNRRDRGNRRGVNAGQVDAPSEAPGKDREVPEATVAPNVAGELGTPSEVGEQGNTARSVNKQGRGSRQITSTGVPNAASEAKDKSRKAPQPTAAPNVAEEQRMPPATSDQEGSHRNVNRQEKSGRQEPAAVDASRDRGRSKGADGQASGPRESKKDAPPSSNQPAAVENGAPKQKEQRQVEHRQSAPPQPGNSQQRSNERKHEQKSPSPPAAPTAKQSKESQQQPAEAAAQQKAPSQPPKTSQGKGKGKGDGDKTDEKKNEGGN